MECDPIPPCNVTEKDINLKILNRKFIHSVCKGRVSKRPCKKFKFKRYQPRLEITFNTKTGRRICKLVYSGIDELALLKDLKNLKVN